MADVSGQAILNEAALKRLDPYVKKVIDTAKFVALYTFKLKENKWEKTGVEGSLFVYSRTGEPFYNILVLNRLNTTNLFEPISSKLTLQLHEPFLLYLNAQCCLYGMWFYEKEECTRLAALIEKLMKESSEHERSPRGVKNPNGASVDIYNMLSRAQEACNTAKVNGSFAGDTKRVKSQEADQQTPQSVMEFFAKAVSAPKKTTVPSPGSGLVLPRSRSLSEDDNNEMPANPLIHQLMSNPVHLVEHIEKQQRLVTPHNNEIPGDKVLKLLIRQAGQSLVTPEPQEFAKDHGKKSLKLDNGLNNHSSPSKVSLLLPIYPHSDGKNLMLFSSPNSVTESPRKPALMPPAMFAPHNRKDSTESTSDNFKLEPLTRNQLFQAINYLLKNDPVFMTKIHEAYVKSLTDKVL